MTPLNIHCLRGSPLVVQVCFRLYDNAALHTTQDTLPENTEGCVEDADWCVGFKSVWTWPSYHRGGAKFFPPFLLRYPIVFRQTFKLLRLEAFSHAGWCWR